MMLQQRCVTRSMTVSRWASMPAEMIAGFHSAGVTNYIIGGDFWATDPAGRFCEQRTHLGTSRLLPFLVKLQLVCKAWYAGAGRSITSLSLRSFHASPVPVFQTFTALIHLRLDLRYVAWSDLQSIGHLVHLQHLHLVELHRQETVQLQDRAFARKTSGCGSPFSCLSDLRSLKLDLHESSSTGNRCFLRPISCMNNLQGFTLLGLSTNIGIQHLSQLSQLTSLGVGHVEDGLSTLMKLKHLEVAAVSPRLPTSPLRPTVNLSASLVTLNNLRSLDCTLVRYCQVSSLSVLTALNALNIYLVPEASFDHQSCTAIWSDLAELTHLTTLSVHGDAFLDAKDLQAIALLSCLTKLHFDGFTSDLDFRTEDVNKLSALASLQYLYLDFIDSWGRWYDAVKQLDIHLMALLKGANMQHFQVISHECGCDYDTDHRQSGDDDSSLGAWDGESDMGSDNVSDMYSQQSDE